VAGLDDLARILFPDNRNHRRAFITIWVAVKYAPDQFVPSMGSICARNGVSERTTEIVRAKMKKMGLLKRVSHFDPAYGYNAGWTFSCRFSGCLSGLARMVADHRQPSRRRTDKQKDRDSILYV